MPPSDSEPEQRTAPSARPDPEATGGTARQEDEAATGPATGTSAVRFDPFADDDDEEPTEAQQVDGEIAALIDELGELRDRGPTGAIDPSERSRREAIDAFRRRRGAHRSARPVADGMVTLPFIDVIPEEDALKDPAEAGSTVAPPQLNPGDMVAGQYEIMGVIGHGGMGWIYLANDHFVSDRVVVLKGMQAQKSQREARVADTEREFLAAITHPGIVKLFNFIDDPRIPGGFIVMEYVGGPSLRDLMKGYPGGVMPIDVAIGYILEVLPSMEYLHSRGAVYNDLKPENILATEDQVKLVDLGAVSGVGAFGYIYGTKGYQAPDVLTHGPTVASDIYTIGRTLAALTMKLPTEDGVLAPGLPSPREEPLLRQFISFYRLLRRATHPDPEKRFRSVAVLRRQLYGVLRECLAIRDSKQFAARHSLFSPQRRTFGTKHLVFRTDQLLDGIDRTVRITSLEVMQALPVPLVDTSDPGAGLLSGFSYTEPEEALETLRQAMRSEDYRHSTEVPLGVVRALLDLGLTSQARDWLNSLEERLGEDWRFLWYAAVTSLLLDRYGEAQRYFFQVLTLLPGEAAPKLALAAVNELALQEMGVNANPLLTPERVRSAVITPGEPPDETNLPFFEGFGEDWSHVTQDPAYLRFHTLRLYGLVWATNPSTVSSAFGLARQYMAENQVELAVAALDRVPQASRHQRMAKLTSILMLISSTLTESRIRRAGARLEEIPTMEPRFLQIQTAVMAAGLRFLHDAHLTAAASSNDLMDYPFTQTGLRTGLADALRRQARNAPFPRHRYELVDLANRVRPVTWF